MADPRRQSSGTDGAGSFFRRRIPVDRPEPSPPAPDTETAARASGVPAEPEPVPEEALFEEIFIGPDPVEEAGKEVRELTDSLVRLQAEFDNYRKRQAREFRRLSSQGRKELVNELLVVLDNFDRAENHRASIEESPQELAEGLFRTVDQMRRILSQFGLSDLDVRPNDPFDPNIHEAVLADEVDGLVRDSVLEIFQKGYLFDQDLLRPAMVRVGKAAPGIVEPPAAETVADAVVEEITDSSGNPIPDSAGDPSPEDDDLEIEYEGEWSPAKE